MTRKTCLNQAFDYFSSAAWIFPDDILFALSKEKRCDTRLLESGGFKILKFNFQLFQFLWFYRIFKLSILDWQWYTWRSIYLGVGRTIVDLTMGWKASLLCSGSVCVSITFFFQSTLWLLFVGQVLRSRQERFPVNSTFTFPCLPSSICLQAVWPIKL